MTAKEVRERFLSEYAENISKNTYETADTDKISVDDKVSEVYLLHNNGDVAKALKFMHTSLEWRKSFKVRDLNSSSFPPSLVTSNTIFFCNKDRSGHSMLHVQVLKMKKDSSYTDTAKKYFVWQLEKAFQANMGQRIVVLLDMCGTGIYNVDTNFIKFLISCFTTYYPYMLEYLLIVELPWILNAVWSVIKTWLTAEQQKFVIVVNKKNLPKYVCPDQLFTHLGGICEVPCWSPRPSEDFTDVIETSVETSVEATLANQNHNLSPKVRKRNMKSLMVAPMRQESEDEMISFPSENNLQSLSPIIYEIVDLTKANISSVSINPSEYITFESNLLNDSGIVLTVNNKSPCYVAYKVKTTSPDIFRVRPIMGYVPPQSSKKISVTLMSGKQCNTFKDKFLVMLMMMRSESVVREEGNIASLWKTITKNPDDFREYMLSCRVDDHADCSSHSTTHIPNGGFTPNAMPNEDILEQLKLISRYQMYMMVVLLVVALKVFIHM